MSKKKLPRWHVDSDYKPRKRRGSSGSSKSLMTKAHFEAFESARKKAQPKKSWLSKLLGR